MEHTADAFIPFTLEERQTNWYNVVTMVTEEVHCSMGAINQLSTAVSPSTQYTNLCCFCLKYIKFIVIQIPLVNLLYEVCSLLS